MQGDAGAPRLEPALHRIHAVTTGSVCCQPKVFLRFELRHPEQEIERVELVASRQPGQFGSSLRNESRGLVRLMVIIFGRRPLPCCARDRRPGLGQK